MELYTTHDHTVDSFMLNRYCSSVSISKIVKNINNHQINAQNYQETVKNDQDPNRLFISYLSIKK